MRSAVRVRVVTVAGMVALVAALLATPVTPALAQATPVFINEIHYDNAGGDVGEFVEIAGPAGTDLSGWQVVPYNGNGGATYTPVGGLSGVLGDDTGTGHGVTAVAISGLQNGAPDGVALVDDGGGVVQFLSYEGSFTATNGPANGMTSTDIGVSEPGDTPIGHSLQLTGTGTTYEDFGWAPPGPETPGEVNTGQSFGDAPIGPTTDCQDSYTFQEGTPATTSISASHPDEALSTVVGTNALPSAFSVADFTVAPSPGGTATLTLSYSGGSAPASSALPLQFEGPTVVVPCSTALMVAPLVRIHDVQGAGATTPLGGDTVTVQGVVTSLFERNDALDGFFVQEEDADADADASTSEGIFVFCRGNCPEGLAEGDLATVTGRAGEFFGMTQITATSSAGGTSVAGTAPLPTPVAMDLPAAGRTDAEDTFETTEGMVVAFPDRLEVSEYFQLARFGQVVLTVDSRPYQFTHTDLPSQTGYQAFQDELASRRIILDDNNNENNDATAGPADDEAHPYPEPGLSTTNRFRGGDSVTGLTGVLHWSFAGSGSGDAWRVRPIDSVAYTFDPDNPQPAAPEAVGGTLRVAAFNVLNYFTTIDVTSSNSTGHCGPSGTQDCRGADSEVERERQLAKIVATIQGLGADVVGLVELQNDGDDASAASIVAALNATPGPTWSNVPTGFLGSDAIKVGMIHTDAVSIVGAPAVLDTPAFVDPLGTGQDRNRPALAVSFADVDGAVTTVAVNHFKSKGTSGLDCADPSADVDCDQGDGQGNWAATRTASAVALADWLDTDPTGSGDPDVLITGDLNAYRNEDAIRALEDRGYVDLIERFQGDGAYSFVFDGQLGYLDHALASTSLADQVSGATEWHTNADEVNLFDYNDDVQDAGEASFERESHALPLFHPDAFRAADHDPVLVGIDPTPLTCDGLEITIHGTAGDDVIVGTDGDDVIHGLAGADTIDGGNGDDVICGGSGDDTIDGGNGKDVLLGEAGHDALSGGNGKDDLRGGPGDDVLDGQNGKDTGDGGEGVNACRSVEHASGCE